MSLRSGRSSSFGAGWIASSAHTWIIFSPTTPYCHKASRSVPQPPRSCTQTARSPKSSMHRYQITSIILIQRSTTQTSARCSMRSGRARIPAMIVAGQSLLALYPRASVLTAPPYTSSVRDATLGGMTCSHCPMHSGISATHILSRKLIDCASFLKARRTWSRGTMTTC
jgi:hypothetical protein